MARTNTPPPADRGMWRRALARCHPDAGGAVDLFVWACGVREFVRREDRSPLRNDSTPRAYATVEYATRVPYDAALGFVDEFVTLTMRALSVGQHAEEPYRSVLALLIDCPADDHGRAAAKQERGASYRQLGRIAHDAGMTEGERMRWYDLARSIPLSERHASHIIGRLDRGEAA
jgi:hypothetical protein